MAANDDMREFGSSGLMRTGGFIEEEFLRELRGERLKRTIREMRDNDPIIGAVLFAIEMMVRRVSWTVLPASETKADREAADFVSSCLHDMSQDWTAVIAEILSMLEWGWAYFEQVYKIRRGPEQKDGKYRSTFNDGRIGWRKWGIRAQETLDEWAFDEEGGIAGMWQIAPPNYQRVLIPIDKALLFRTTVKKNNPEGRSILRNAYRPWYMKKNIENIEGVGIERDLAGLPIAWIDPQLMASDASPEQKALYAIFKEIVVNIRRDEQEGIVFPLAYDENGRKLYDLTLLSSGGQRQFDTDKIVNRYDTRIAMTVLADFILTGHEGVGSYALVTSKTGMFMTALNAYLDLIGGVMEDGSAVGVVNQYAIPRLLRLNKMAVTAPPMLDHGNVETIDLAALGTFISQLAGAGALLFPNPDLESDLMQKAGLPYTVE